MIQNLNPSQYSLEFVTTNYNTTDKIQETEKYIRNLSQIVLRVLLKDPEIYPNVT